MSEPILQWGFAPIGTDLVETHRQFLVFPSGATYAWDNPAQLRNALMGAQTEFWRMEITSRLAFLESGIQAGAFTHTSADPMGQLVMAQTDTTQPGAAGTEKLGGPTSSAAPAIAGLAGLLILALIVYAVIT